MIRRLSIISPAYQSLVMLLLSLSSLNIVIASVQCFNTALGNSLPGADYHRIRGIPHRGCALQCRDDPSCMAYEWNSSSLFCYLKSRSLTGSLIKSEDTHVGFCIDREDEMRERFHDHTIEGPILKTFEDIEGEDCITACQSVDTATIYSWTPHENENDDYEMGTCSCIEAIRGLHLSFGAHSGFLPLKQHKYRFRR